MAVNELVVGLNNWLVRRRRRRVGPGELLLLLPSCLQRSGCERSVRAGVENCERCGRCQLGEVLEMAERLGVRVSVATGGELALEEARGDGVRAIVAVACAKELRVGIFGTWPKAVLAVKNERPHGPCKDTRVDVAALSSALEFFLGEPEPTESGVRDGPPPADHTPARRSA